MPSLSFSGEAFSFDIGYDEVDGGMKITSVTTTAIKAGWAAWELTPSFYVYILKGNEPVPYELQHDGGSASANNENIIKWITDRNGIYVDYNGNRPSELLSNTKGGVVNWAADKFSTLSITNAANVTVGACIANTTQTLSNAVYGSAFVSLYKPPSNLTISALDITQTSFKISADWTAGQNSDGRAYITANGQTQMIDTAETPLFSGLTPNTTYTVTGRLADNVNPNASYDTDSINVLTLISNPTSWKSTASTTTSITVSASSANGGNFKYQYRIQKAGVWSAWQDSGSFTGLNNNTKYLVEARCINTDNNNTSGSLSGFVWTYPVIAVLNVVLKAGSEHNTINATASSTVSSGFDEYQFRLDSTSTLWQTVGKSWSGLNGNSTHTVGVIMRNTSSGLQSAEVTKTITTWYDPIYSLTVNMTNNWFWYLAVNATVDYQGGAINIPKFEFDIGGEGYKDKGNTNGHSRGSTSSTGTGKLAYNTSYVCKVRVTDNHGRTKEASATFKTLDERPLYVDGVLREVKVIKPDGSITYVTPNLLSVIDSSGKITNMNKIINNDSRTQFS